MFDGAKRSAEAKSTVLGPHGPWFERPVPGVKPTEPLTLLVPALTGQSLALASTLAVLAAIMVVKGSTSSSINGAITGLIVAVPFVVLIVGRSRASYSAARSAPATARYRSDHRSRQDGASTGLSPAIFPVIYAFFSRHDQQDIVSFGTALVSMYAASCWWQLWSAHRLERRSGGRLSVESVRGYSLLAGTNAVFINAPALLDAGAPA